MARRQTRRRRQPVVHFASPREARALHRLPKREFVQPDLYVRLLTLGWPGFFALLAAAYLVFNLIFAGLYLLQPGSVANARPGAFTDSFFFSVQTMATIGYGDMHPATLYANLLVTVEVLLALMGLALATGVIFARFSRPTARVLFSRQAVVAPHEGLPTLMFRAANQRLNRVLNAQVTVTLVRNELTQEGLAMRRFHELDVLRSRTPLFVLSWTVMHAIDESSPLHGETAQSLSDAGAEIIVTLLGLDETFSQTINARHNYAAEEIVWQHRFVDIIGTTPDGRTSIDYARFHDTAPIEE